jgi:hypothetical protein
VRLLAVIVEPWKQPLKAKMPDRHVDLRAIFKAISMASEPEGPVKQILKLRSLVGKDANRVSTKSTRSGVCKSMADQMGDVSK